MPLSHVRFFVTWKKAMNIGVGSLSLLQGIFPTQGSNPGLPTLHVDSSLAEPQGKSNSDVN